MADALGLLLLLAVAALAVGMATWAVIFVLGRVAARSPRHEEVLPSHYSSLVNTAPARYPGYCSNCGATNDPEYGVCKNCSSKLSESRHEPSEGTPNAFLKE